MQISVRQTIAEVPDGVCRILAKGSAKNSSDRYQTASELIQSLDAVLHSPEVSRTYAEKSVAAAGPVGPQPKDAGIKIVSLLKGRGMMGKTLWVVMMVVFSWLLAVSLRQGHSPSGAPVSAAPQRVAIPIPAQQAKAERTIHDVFKGQYALTDPKSRATLATTLVEQGIQTDDDAASKYVLFREARDLAAGVGDFATAFRAVDEMSKAFVVDAAEARVATLVAAAPRLEGKEVNAALAGVCLDEIDAALAGEKEGLATRLLPVVETAARKAQSAALLANAQAQGPRVRVAATLRQHPDDPNANAIEGRWLCLGRGNWDKGLPMLAKGSDAALKELAAREIASRSNAAPGSSADALAPTLAVADAWWEYGERQGEPGKTAARRHASEWYAAARPGLKGLDAARADARGVKAAPPPAPPRTTPGPVSPPPGPTAPGPTAPGPAMPALTLAPNPTGKMVFLRALAGLNLPIRNLQISRDGRLVRAGAWAKGQSDAGGVWAVGDGKLLFLTESLSGDLSPDGRLVLQNRRLYATDTGAVIHDFAPPPAYGVVRGHAFSPDGLQFAVTVHGPKDSAGQQLPAALLVGDPKTGTTRKQISDWHNDVPASIAFSPDGRRILVGTGEDSHSMGMWDLDSSKNLWLATLTEPANRVRFCSGGTRVYTAPAHKGTTVNVLDAETGKIVASLKHTGHVTSVDVTADGKLALTSSEDSASPLRLWDVETGKDLGRFATTQACGAAALVPGDRSVVAGFADGSVRLFDLATGKELDSATGHTGPVTALSVWTDGKLAASGSEDKTVRLWRLPDDAADSAAPTAIAPTAPPTPTMQPPLTVQPPLTASAGPFTLPNKPGLVRSFPWPKPGLKGLQITADLRRVIGSPRYSGGQTVLWDTEAGKALAMMGNNADDLIVGFCRLLPDGKRLLLAKDGRWTLHDVESGRELSTLGEGLGHRGVLSTDGTRLLATDEKQGLVTLTELGAPAQTKRFEHHPAAALLPALSPDGKTFAAATFWADFVLHLWDTDGGKELYHADNKGGCDKLEFSHDGKWLLHVAHAPGVFVHDAKTGRILVECVGPTRASDAVLAASGRFVAVGYWDNKPDGVALFDLGAVEKGKVKPMIGLQGATGYGVNTLALSADDHLLLAACRDKALRLFDARTGKFLGKFDQEADVTGCAFSPDGRCAVSSDDKNLYLWRLPDAPGGK